jgi:hypothetical protein
MKTVLMLPIISRSEVRLKHKSALDLPSADAFADARGNRAPGWKRGSAQDAQGRKFFLGCELAHI